MKKQKQTYWYLTTTYACPVCGSEDTYKERQYTPKPKDINERFRWIDDYDWCEG